MFKILIADDEPNILDGLKLIINWDEHGIEIAGQVQNGAEAMQILATTTVDILLTDIRMPKMDGLSLIRQLKKDGRNIRFIILSGYDDFEYIKEAIKLGIENYLLKPVNRDELSTTLLGTVEKIEGERRRNTSSLNGISIFRENILYRWLTNGISDEELREKASLANIDLCSQYYIAAIVRLLCKKGQEPAKQREAADAAAKSICTQFGSGNDTAAAFSGINGDTVLIFGTSRQDMRIEIKALLEGCIEGLVRHMPCDVFISIGSTESGFQNAHNSFISASELQNYSLILPGNSIMDYEQAAKAISDRKMTFVIDFQSFNRLLTTGQRDECFHFVDDIFIRLAAKRGIKPKFVQNVAMELLYRIINTVEDSTKGRQGSDSFETDFSNVYGMHTINELKEWLMVVVSKALDSLSSNSFIYSPHVKSVLAFIHENYNKELSIKQLSTLFNINATYLGQLFKSETGEMFTNYINNLRIEKAKELLHTTNMNATVISELVGYSNTNYFYRIFKKLTGVSPTDYR